MIKLFRNIRKNLLNEGKTTKYFKYAVGEIILVVIGILIALQINTWNEERKTNNNQEKYLILLKKEAVNNLNSLNRSQEFITRLEKGQDKLLNLLSADLDTIKESYISEVFADVFSYTTHFNYQNNVLSELKTTGEFKNITNDSIRGQLMSQEALVAKIVSQENSVEDRYHQASDLIKRYGSRRRIMEVTARRLNVDVPASKRIFDNIDMLQMREFENITMSYIGVTYSLSNGHYPSLEKHFETLIKMIDQELSQGKTTNQ
jgi:hypothetical protein